jgi:hypothetical protein
MRSVASSRIGMTRHFGAPAERPQTWLPRHHARLAIGGHPAVRGVTENTADRRRIPAPLSARCRNSLGLQAAADVRQRQTLLAHPGKYLLNHARLVQHNLKPSLATPVVLGDIAIAIGCRAEDADTAATGGMQLAAATAIQDLGALIFGDDPLHLQQQVILGTAAQFAVEENYLHAATLQLIHQQELICVLPREPVRRMYVESIDGPIGYLVAQSFQGRSDQTGAAVTIVDKAQLRIQDMAVRFNALPQGGQLTGDGSGLGLPF